MNAIFAMEAWKILFLTRDLAKPVRRSNQLIVYEATNVGNWSFLGFS